MCIHRGLVVVLLAVMNAILLASAGGQETTPAAPPAEVAEKAQHWLEVFNSGDFEAMKQLYAADADAADEGGSKLLRMYESYLQTRGIDASSIEQTSKNILTITGEERLTGNRVNLLLDVFRETPRIAGLRMVRTPEAQSALSSKSEAEILQGLDTTITRVAELDEFAGTVLVMKDGKEIFKKAWGLANKSTGAPNRPNTKAQSCLCREDVYRGFGIAIGPSRQTLPG